MRRETLRKAEARRIALVAQGFGVPRLERPVTMRDVQAVASRLAQFQIDSINVVTRAQFMPLFSRLGPYDPALLERAAYQAPRRLFEYWGRGQPDRCLPSATAPIPHGTGFPRCLGWVSESRGRTPISSFIRDEVAARGPISARDLEVVEERDRSNWGWNWSRVKLFWSGCSTPAK